MKWVIIIVLAIAALWAGIYMSRNSDENGTAKLLNDGVRYHRTEKNTDWDAVRDSVQTDSHRFDG